MSLRDRCAGMVSRLRHPQTPVRWRLTLLYGGLFLVSGVVLLAITYTLVAHATVGGSGPGFVHTVKLRGSSRQVISISRSGSAVIQTGRPIQAFGLGSGTKPGSRQAGFTKTPVPLTRINKLLRSRIGEAAAAYVGSGQRIEDLHQLVIESSLALAIMAVISTVLGWLVAGRALRPLRTMTAATRQISEVNLHERLAMPGPPDELRQLADTIDGLLGRLQGAFDAQRRFVANASHELRTPLTAARALLELVLSDPQATVRTFRETCRQVLDEGEQQEQLIEALLALARGQRGIALAEPIDLAAIAGDVVAAHQSEAAARGLEIDLSLKPASLCGDRRLIERLLANLVDNALRHNTNHGRVQLWIETLAGKATVRIANTGSIVPADETDRLLQPFQRLTASRTGHGDGLGLGLSIVAAIASAHRAALDVQPGPSGGLRIEVRFPPASEIPARVRSQDTPIGAGI